jgi:hypothetical protein
MSRWKKVELRKTYATPLGQREEIQVIDRHELESEQRELIRTRQDQLREQFGGKSPAERRSIEEKFVDPDAWALEQFEEKMQQTALEWLRMPIIEKMGDSVINFYPTGTIGRVSLRVLEMEDVGSTGE